MATIQTTFASSSLHCNVTFSAIIPIGKSKTPLKTLYLLHGIFGNHQDWMYNTRITPWAEKHNLAVIMPSGENSFYVDNEKSGSLYGNFFGKELVDVTRELFPLSHKYEDTFIAGLSMGGFGAVRTGLKYHETFSHIAGLSSGFILEGTLDASDDKPGIIHKRGYYESVFGDLSKVLGSDKDPKALAKSLKESAKKIPKIYLSCGTEDFLIEQNRDFHNYLNSIKMPHEYVEGPGAHTWDYWDEYILKVINWLPLD